MSHPEFFRILKAKKVATGLFSSENHPVATRNNNGGGIEDAAAVVISGFLKPLSPKFGMTHVLGKTSSSIGWKAKGYVKNSFTDLYRTEGCNQWSRNGYH